MSVLFESRTNLEPGNIIRKRYKLLRVLFIPKSTSASFKCIYGIHNQRVYINFAMLMNREVSKTFQVGNVIFMNSKLALPGGTSRKQPQLYRLYLRAYGQLRYYCGYKQVNCTNPLLCYYDRLNVIQLHVLYLLTIHISYCFRNWLQSRSLLWSDIKQSS